ncbi:far upstream element-binding protein 2-like isoform X2 [Denticeps clupeoides]|uniref:far upstream element-binding protein 2-like isoform X2 n=1 Tax=Denticeps clupeoides TaxID=299321 RepID=UPI0010A44597|nr:far upstream element-binding protein 2-like isoform X2 [Denticeps clupeoides]
MSLSLSPSAIGAQLAALAQQRPSSSMEDYCIPGGMVGLIIGRVGEQINKSKDDPDSGRLIGVQQARGMVQESLRERDQPGYGDQNEYGSNIGGGMDVILFYDGTGPDKIAHVIGPPDRCDHATRIITDLLQSIRTREEGQGPPGMTPAGRGRGQSSWGPPGGEMTFSVPAHKCGLVIGRGGENVKAINQQTGAFVELSHQMPPNGDPNLKPFVIRGSPQQIDHARQLIEDKIEDPPCPVGPGSSGPVGPYNPSLPGAPGPLGGPPDTYQQWQPRAPHDPDRAADPNTAWAAYYAQHYQQPPGSGPATPTDPPAGQPDYTKAWEEYYKQTGQTGSSAPQTGAMGSTVGQTDYSAAWAEYYGQQNHTDNNLFHTDSVKQQASWERIQLASMNTSALCFFLFWIFFWVRSYHARLFYNKTGGELPRCL